MGKPFKAVNVNRGRTRTARTPQVEEEILEMVEENSDSTRRMSARVGISKTVINQVLREQQLHPFREKRVTDVNYHKNIY